MDFAVRMNRFKSSIVEKTPLIWISTASLIYVIDSKPTPRDQM